MRASANLAVTVLGAALVAVLVGVLWFGTGDPAAAPSARPSDAVPTTTSGHITVHASGAVLRPGLVVVPQHARIADVVRAAGGLTSDADLAGVNLAASVGDGDHVVVPRMGELVRSGVSAAGVDLNRASASELEELQGVGPVLAERIVDHRDEHGPFRTVEDLLDVPGIGEAKLALMRPGIAEP